MKKILIIEDELQVMDAYEKKLRKDGFEVISARTSDEGLRLAKISGPDLIILDILLPGTMSGIGVLKSIKLDEDIKNVPILMLTNLDSSEIEARDLGVADYIIKSNISIDGVVARVRQCLAEKR